MAISANDLVVDRGVLEPKLFWPALSRSKALEKLNAFLADAVTRTSSMTAGADKDEAQRQWAYYRAYAEVYNRLSISAESIDVRDEGSRSNSKDMRDRVKLLMDEALAAFEDLAEPAEVEADSTFAVIQSRR